MSNEVTQSSGKRLPAKMKVTKQENGNVQVSVDGNKSAFKESFGTNSLDFAEDLLNRTMKVVVSNVKTVQECSLNSTLAGFNGLDPQDEIEAMIGSHIIALNKIILQFLSNASYSEQSFEGRTAYVNRTFKLMKAFNSQVELLNKYRNRGKQKVLVEHVNISEGGQAVFGNINTGGSNDKKAG